MKRRKAEMGDTGKTVLGGMLRGGWGWGRVNTRAPSSEHCKHAEVKDEIPNLTICFSMK